jgi:hypothetical protein
VSIGLSLGMQLGRTSPPSSGVTYAWTDLGQDAVIAAAPGGAVDGNRVPTAVSPFAGKVFLGYGSNNVSCRPMYARYYDPGDGTFKSIGGALAGGLSSDGSYIHFASGDKLWITATDPAQKGPSQDAMSIDGSLTGALYQTDPPYSEHIWGGCGDPSGAIYLAGSSDSSDGNPNTPTVWRSADGGTTWAKVQQEASQSGFVYHFIFYLGTKLWVQCADLNGHAQVAYSSTDGVTWSNAAGLHIFPNVVSAFKQGGRSVVFNGAAYVVGAPPETVTGVFLYRFDGVSDGVDVTPFVSVRDVAVGHGAIWATTRAREVSKSSDGTTWTVVSNSGVNNPAKQGIGVFDGTVYVGDTNAHLWAVVPSAPDATAWLTDANGVYLHDESGNPWTLTQY